MRYNGREFIQAFNRVNIVDNSSNVRCVSPIVSVLIVNVIWNDAFSQFTEMWIIVSSINVFLDYKIINWLLVFLKKFADIV